MSDTNFHELFKTLTGAEEPFPWQTQLFSRFAKGDFPSCCDLPTGLGKTSVVAIWLIALAKYPNLVPRRLVYVVNRRTVVDQTTEEVAKLRRNLGAAGLNGVLKYLCAIECDCPLAISTLRGQFADNREWAADPCRPAVIVGTVDMIGSRLLFGGYRLGFRTRPFHAGFLGQEVLLVHDEAHLEPAFQDLLTSIVLEQTDSGDFRKMRVMELSATPRSVGDSFGLTKADEMNGEVSKRLNASKKLNLHAVDTVDRLPETLVSQALRHKDSGLAVLVFARTLKDVEKVFAALNKDKRKVGILTGTMRGKERDELIKTPVFQRFLPPSDSSPATEPPAEGTVYLICTSAGEVGINMSADHLICDLATFDSMAQRFGRVNRFGEREDTEIDVVHPIVIDEKDELGIRLARTLAVLRELNGCASPNAIRSVDAATRRDAFRPPPIILPVSDILFDAWSLTTIFDKLPGRPPVAPYLHGVVENEPPETQVAWREEVGIVTNELTAIYQPAELLADYPLKPHELLRDRSSRVAETLAVIEKRSPATANLPVWLLDDDGQVTVMELGALTGKRGKDRLNNRTLLLPPSAGGLNHGLLDGQVEPTDDLDVADEWLDAERQQRRCRVWDDQPAHGRMRLIRVIDTRPEEDEEIDDRETPARRLWCWYEAPRSADSEGSRFASKAILLDTHSDDVERRMQSFAEKLGLPPDLALALRLAGRFHDLGKRRRHWQQGIGNFEPDVWLAKSGSRVTSRSFNTYRHEFGSLIDLPAKPEFQELTEEMKEIVLHLIAAHHGRARPHFTLDETLDNEREKEPRMSLLAEIPRRFARLQRTYGRWGLAYLESLLRAADYAASAQPSQTVEDEP